MVCNRSYSTKEGLGKKRLPPVLPSPLPLSRFAGEGMEAAWVFTSVLPARGGKLKGSGPGRAAIPRPQWLCPTAANGSNRACPAACPFSVTDTIAFSPACGT